MNDIDSQFRTLRVSLRKHGKTIAEDVFRRVHPTAPKNVMEICVFCSSIENITKEHVLPVWLFEGNTAFSMISTINKQTQHYHKAVIPACQNCNNIVLATIEKNIINSLKKLDVNKNFGTEDLFNIIRWFEILDYKLQVNEFRRKYIRCGKTEYDREWADFSVAMLRHFYEMNPFKAYNHLRQSQNRITIKKKDERLKSLLIFEKQSSDFYFFNLPNEYLFISFPMFKIAIFYYLKKNQGNTKEALSNAYEIISNVVNDKI